MNACVVKLLIIDPLFQVSLESGNEVEWSKEENYMFPLSLYRDRLLEWVDSTPSCKPLLRSCTMTFIEHG